MLCYIGYRTPDGALLFTTHRKHESSLQQAFLKGLFEIG